MKDHSMSMEFVKEYFFYNINIGDVDEIFVKASSDCSNRYIHSYSFRLIFNVKIIDERDNKMKKKYLYIHQVGVSYFCVEWEKKGIK